MQRQIGLPLGIVAGRNDRFSEIIWPLLDVMPNNSGIRLPCTDRHAFRNRNRTRPHRDYHICTPSHDSTYQLRDQTSAKGNCGGGRGFWIDSVAALMESTIAASKADHCGWGESVPHAVTFNGGRRGPRRSGRARTRRVYEHRPPRCRDGDSRRFSIVLLAILLDRLTLAIGQQRPNYERTG
jgi:hypothetical protein